MNLMTFSNFLFVSLEGLIFTSKFLTVPNRIPIRLVCLKKTFISLLSKGLHTHCNSILRCQRNQQSGA